MNKTEYLLVCLMEEASEVQQAAAKALRFGLDNHHPDRKETNVDELMHEIAHVYAIQHLLETEGAIPAFLSLSEQTRKVNQVEHFMQVSWDCGTLGKELVEVVHGEWQNGYFQDIVCSACLHPSPVDKQTMYCPNCGALMEKDGAAK